MKLIIVESPTKAKTISQFLGKDFKVESSYGHVRDLPISSLGVDTEHNFEPKYVIPTKAKKRVSELKNAAGKAKEIILATDEDREGEAIAWHLAQALGLKNSNRIVFHEITKNAIEKALKEPRKLDINLVNAQQARRILDRLVGYELSPFLWRKIFKGLSAGRVQSVAVRIIVDREREIQKFIPEEYWTVTATLKKNKEFEAKLIKQEIKNKEKADKILKDLEGAKYIVSNIEKKEEKRFPRPPFTTSTLQQEAANKLYFSAKQTMMLAQLLYESGYISYMRTDSVNLSEESLILAKNFIEKNFGKNYVPLIPRKFKTKSKGAQEAHEAIRPTNPGLMPDAVREKLEPKQFKLYDLIWRRFIACQMKEAIFDMTAVDITAKSYEFRAHGQTLKFDGFLKIYQMKFAAKGEPRQGREEAQLPELKKGDNLELIKLNPDQHFTEPPARYSEATLVKALEEHGIGRPSTYAPIIATIQTRNYVAKNEQRKFVPTETGIMVNDLLVEHFPEIVDINFTSKMEDELDDIAEGKIKWTPVIKNFYTPFHKNLEEKYKKVEKKKIEEETNEICEKCGKPMVVKQSRFGKFLACSGFPECKNTKSLKQPPKEIGMKCPKCQIGDIIVKRTKRGKIFYGCSRYPECDFASWSKPENLK